MVLLPKDFDANFHGRTHGDKRKKVEMEGKERRKG